ncbi:hypothetical protein BDN72DRAFT_958783 [Pluteus cervinus]|uniref:Uncharacterized protein n=1 Tax=Pluteus cervinus TaxID=181527 RepID=A0ACD3AYA4_9AGAR|nr:hypothetical protein BDN72DRAFT_958783 [Pluteus cervinus]
MATCHNTMFHFPFDIVHEILTQLKCDCISLKSCSLVNKDWLYLSRPLLYKSITLSILSSNPSSEILSILDFGDYKPRYTTNLTIKSTPTTTLNIVSPSFGPQLDRFTHLHTLTLSRVHLPHIPIPSPREGFTRRITTLRIHRVYYSSQEDILRFIFSFPAVQCLSILTIAGCLHITMPLQISTPGGRTTSSIRCLHTCCGKGTSLGRYIQEYLVQDDHPGATPATLKRLDIGIGPKVPRNHYWVATVVKSVEVLVLGLNWDTESRFNNGDSGGVELKLEPGHSLHTLIISICIGAKHERAINYVFIPNLFRSLHIWSLFRCLTLSFTSPSTSYRDINETLAVGIKLKAQDVYLDTGPYGKKEVDSIWEMMDQCCAHPASGNRRGESIQKSTISAEGGRVGFIGQSNRDEHEMGAEEFDRVVKSLLPLSQEHGFEVKPVLRLDTRVSGIWEDCQYEE